jgi:sigma-B regulation protein RsbU (phosphoserine phosphatase)
MARIRLRIATKLVLSFGLAFTLIFSAVFAYSFFAAEKFLESRVQEDARHKALVILNGIDTILLSASKMPRHLAVFLEQTPFSPRDLEETLRQMVLQNPEVFGSTAAFEPFAFLSERRFYAPYVYRQAGRIRAKYLGSEPFDYFQEEWYRMPRKHRRAMWSEPYFDSSGGRIIMSTYSVPFFHNQQNQRRLWGIVVGENL